MTQEKCCKEVIKKIKEVERYEFDDIVIMQTFGFLAVHWCNGSMIFGTTKKSFQSYQRNAQRLSVFHHF